MYGRGMQVKVCDDTLVLLSQQLRICGIECYHSRVLLHNTFNMYALFLELYVHAVIC